MVEYVLLHHSISSAVAVARFFALARIGPDQKTLKSEFAHPGPIARLLPEATPGATPGANPRRIFTRAKGYPGNLGLLPRGTADFR